MLEYVEGKEGSKKYGGERGKKLRNSEEKEGTHRMEKS